MGLDGIFKVVALAFPSCEPREELPATAQVGCPPTHWDLHWGRFTLSESTPLWKNDSLPGLSLRPYCKRSASATAATLVDLSILSISCTLGLVLDPFLQGVSVISSCRCLARILTCTLLSATAAEIELLWWAGIDNRGSSAIGAGTTWP